MTTIYDVLEELRASALSEADKGAKFERLIRAFLRVDPVFAEQFSDVWLWGEYPGNNAKHDTGIDLVARDKDTGHDVAIQCKFFAPTSTVSKPMIDSFLSASGKAGFGERIIVSTTDKWNSNAEDAIKDQAVPVRRIGLPDLEASRIDWSVFSLTNPDKLILAGKKEPRDYQRIAIDKVAAGFGDNDRGKLIMACGTGKTFTSLKLVEENVGAGRKVLFLVPSISLLSQTVREWVANADLPIRPLAVCSDPKSTRRTKSNDAFEDISVTDLALPATTNIATVRKRILDAQADHQAMTVVFSTYQSIDVVATAQQGLAPFDLIVCDEAHRTTGASLAGDESAFVKVHNNDFLPAGKRLYMTATPRIYDDSSKAKAGEQDVVLASMDDETLFGPEFHRLGFGEAVERGLLTDYKVLVLTVDEESVARTFQVQLSDDSNELKLDDAAKIVGCWNGLAKRGDVEHSFEPDLRTMRRAIAFAGSIADSKRIEELFQSVTDYYVSSVDLEDPDGASPLKCNVRHVDGTMNALRRNQALDWLKAEPADRSCHILTNARCLSEGVDVPSLDAVMFLSPRKSVVDIVQSVGRVMRLDKAGGKQYGYIILPIGIPSGMTPEEALKDNKRYAAVWEVLQALRAHDERFDALVNRISLSKARDRKVNVIGVGGKNQWGEQLAFHLATGDLDAWRDAIYAKIVQKVGTREYWTDWAKDVANIATRQTTRIKALLADPNARVREEFERFLDGLRGNLNENVTESDAVDMLAQHLITRPVFNALFAGDEFINNNPVAQTMERMLAALDQHDLEAENDSLQRFYESVRRKVGDVSDPEGRQELVRRLYDTFFAHAFKKTVDKLGIVYTPVPIVDFLLRSADEVLRNEFGQGLTDQGVHVLDGFTGTGTFVVRLLELGLIKPHDLARKYAQELHANEILLLAYYIAAVNIETTYLGRRRKQDLTEEYESFPGLILTDTFQSWEDDDRPDLDVFPENNERLEKLKQLPITVIVGNPPYSSGQDSANDDNVNEKYHSLDAHIEADYLRRGSGRTRGGIYDSYIRAIKWASLRIANRGVIAYVSNGGWLDSNAADGMRKALAEEFSDIYIFNLRGNGRIGGEEGRKEGRPVFEFGGWRSGREIKNTEGGSRATIAITVLVKNPKRRGLANVHYAQVDDYLSAGEKIQAVMSAGSVFGLDAIKVIPNEHGDWLNQRRGDFGELLSISASRKEVGIFGLTSAGLKSNRDSWVYGSSSETVLTSVERMVEVFNNEVSKQPAELTTDPRRISWSTALRKRHHDGKRIAVSADALRSAMYRPFMRQWVYFDRALTEAPSRLPSLFPRPSSRNLVIYNVGNGSAVPFSVLMMNVIPDLHVTGAGSGGFVFGRWRYEAAEDAGMLQTLMVGGEVVDGYRKVDNVTDDALKFFTTAYGPTITKDDIFFYLYGILHSPGYRDAYGADLRKMLPRIPLVDDPWAFVRAGRDLSELHLGYESEIPYPLEGLDVAATGDPYEFYAVRKMVFAKSRGGGTTKAVTDRSSIVFNSKITLSDIPEEAYRYMLGSRSAIEWIMDRYQIKTDKASGIVNDPNYWSREIGDPRYVVDLLARIVTVSLRTMQIVDELPPLAIRDNQYSS